MEKWWTVAVIHTHLKSSRKLHCIGRLHEPPGGTKQNGRRIKGRDGPPNGEEFTECSVNSRRTSNTHATMIHQDFSEPPVNTVVYRDLKIRFMDRL